MNDFNIKDINSKEDLKQLADATVLLATQSNLKSSVYYYAMARYLVAVFEANSFTLPIQVWNEYRNSLDHLIRSFLTQDQNSIDSQLKASRGHLLRACLDVIKLLCTYHDDWFKDLKASKAYFTYALVDNGTFLKSLEDQYTQAKKAMISAKTQDINLGNNTTADTQIVDLYLDAYFSYKQLDEMFHEKQGASIVSSISYYLLYIKANWTTMLFSGSGKFIAVLVIFLFGKYSDNLWNAIKAGWAAF